MTKRVVITGLGLVTPIGSGREEFWRNLTAGVNGIAPVRSFDTSEYPVHIGAEVKEFDPGAWIRTRAPESMGRGSQLAVAAARMALADSGVNLESYDRRRIGVSMGTTSGEPGFVAYFNECMTGFEYQVAGHMIWEGLTEKGLAIARMIHDRYHASRRNPWNEIECSSHYARAMASHGVYLAACGYEYHGPRAHLGFAPRLAADDFRAAFTAAAGWGSLRQKVEDGTQRAEVAVAWGSVRLQSLALEAAPALAGRAVRVERAGKRLEAETKWSGRRLAVTLPQALVLKAGESLAVSAGP